MKTFAFGITSAIALLMQVGKPPTDTPVQNVTQPTFNLLGLPSPPTTFPCIPVTGASANDDPKSPICYVDLGKPAQAPPNTTQNATPKATPSAIMPVPSFDNPYWVSNAQKNYKSWATYSSSGLEMNAFVTLGWDCHVLTTGQGEEPKAVSITCVKSDSK